MKIFTELSKIKNELSSTRQSKDFKGWGLKFKREAFISVYQNCKMSSLRSIIFRNFSFKKYIIPSLSEFSSETSSFPNKCTIFFIFRIGIRSILFSKNVFFLICRSLIWNYIFFQKMYSFLLFLTLIRNFIYFQKVVINN